MIPLSFLYIDPGTGSLIYQAILSGFLTFIVFFKKIVAFIKLAFKSKKEDKNNDSSK